MLQTNSARISYSLPTRQRGWHWPAHEPRGDACDPNGLALPGGDVAGRRGVSGDRAPLRLEGLLGVAADRADLSAGDRVGRVGAVVPADDQLRPARDLAAGAARAGRVRLHLGEPVRGLHRRVPDLPALAAGRPVAT